MSKLTKLTTLAIVSSIPVIYSVTNVNQVKSKSGMNVYRNDSQQTPLPDRTLVHLIKALFLPINYLPNKYFNIENKWAQNIMENEAFKSGSIHKIEDIRQGKDLFLAFGYWTIFERHLNLLEITKTLNRIENLQIEFKILDRFWGIENKQMKSAIVGFEITITNQNFSETFKTISTNAHFKEFPRKMYIKIFWDIMHDLTQSSLMMEQNLDGQKIFEELKQTQSQQELIKVFERIGWQQVAKKSKFPTWKVEYNVLEYNKENGYISVEVEMYEPIVREKIKNVIYLKGFDNKELIVEKIFQQIKNDNKLFTEKLLINLPNNSIYKKQLPSKTKIPLYKNLNNEQIGNINLLIDKSFAEKVTISVQQFDDEKGLILVKVIVKKDDFSKEMEITVQGFRTSSQQNELDVKSLKIYLEDKYKDVKILDNSIYKSLIPSEVKDKLQAINLSNEDLTNLNIEIISQAKLKSAKVVFTIKKGNDFSGVLLIMAQISKGNFSTVFDFEVKGFQSINNRNINEIEILLNTFIKNNNN